MAGGTLSPASAHASAQSECTFDGAAHMAVAPPTQSGMPAEAAAVPDLPQHSGGGTAASAMSDERPGCGSSDDSGMRAGAWQAADTAADEQGGDCQAAEQPLPGGSAAAAHSSSSSDVDLKPQAAPPSLHHDAAAMPQPRQAWWQTAPDAAVPPAPASEATEHWAPAEHSAAGLPGGAESCGTAAVTPGLQQQQAARLPDDGWEGSGDSDNDRDGSEWSHCSDHFMALSAALEAEEADWELL